MATYEFESLWKIRAPLADVWRLLTDPEEWPKWWSGIETVEVLAEGDERGVGKQTHIAWGGKGPMKITFEGIVTDIEPMSVYSRKSTGTVAGEGTWRFSEEEGVTSARYLRSIRTTNWWMNLLSPIVKQIIRSSHERIMHDGAVGLAKFLNAERLAG